MQEVHTYKTKDGRSFSSESQALEHEMSLDHCRFIHAIKAYYLGMDLNLKELITDFLINRESHDDFQPCMVTYTQIFDFFKSQGISVTCIYRDAYRKEYHQPADNLYIGVGIIESQIWSMEIVMDTPTADMMVDIGLMILELNSVKNKPDCKKNLDDIYRDAEFVNPHLFTWKQQYPNNCRIFSLNQVSGKNLIEYLVDLFENDNREIYNKHRIFNDTYVSEYIYASHVLTYSVKRVLPGLGKPVILYKGYENADLRLTKEISDVSLVCRDNQICWQVSGGADKGKIYPIEEDDRWRYYSIIKSDWIDNSLRCMSITP